MFSKPRLALKWLNYLRVSSNGSGHGVHSPFVYQFIREVLMDRNFYPAYSKIEKLRKKLEDDNRKIQVVDYGAGNHVKKRTETSVSEIAGRSLSSRKFGRLLFRLSMFCKAGMIVELGSSLGISTAYLAAGNEKANVQTIEGDPSVAAIAKENLQQLGLGNVTVINGNFDEVLTGVLNDVQPIDLVFIDGNHRKEPLLAYFEKFVNHIKVPALIIVHDIHWSQEMEEAWAVIREDERVKLTIDLFSAGLVFFRDELKVRQHFIIRF